MTLRHTQGLGHIDHDDRVVVLNLPHIEQQQSPYVFAGSAFEVWSRIDGTTSEEQLVDDIVATLGVEREQVAADTAAFLAQLLELGLIEEVD